ncbi:Hypothetical protein D9617_1g088430 [Elsinoe fawcettii]|nr:Hypothetical protein D9617_1g088430 [Elsinoe fawcettii]
MTTDILRPADFKIGIITILDKELNAVRAMFDEHYRGVERGPEMATPIDLAALGLTRSLSLCLSLQAKLKFALLVGIGGGVPSAGVRLGDVVLGLARDKPGVIQYDYGKAIHGQGLVATGDPNKAPAIIVQAVKSLDSDDIFDNEDEPMYVRIIQNLAKNGHQKIRAIAEPPASDKDVIFRADYKHQSGNLDCSACDPTQLIALDEADRNPGSMVHHGVIGSGDEVIKNALPRDELASKHGIVCFDMEVAGVMDAFPCLVFRGISDYCDSHKNDEWHDYAAITAAAYAKSLISTIGNYSLDSVEDAREVIEQHLKQLSIQTMGVQRALDNHREVLISLRDGSEDEKITRWVRGTMPWQAMDQHLQKRHPGTCQWFLKSSEYLDWKSGRSTFLWLRGQAGVGKSVLLATIAQDLLASGGEDCGTTTEPIALPFFFSYNDDRRQTISDAIRSYLVQLYSDSADIRDILAQTYSNTVQADRDLSQQELTDILKRCLGTHDCTMLLVDALDESKAQEELPQLFSTPAKAVPGKTRLLMTARPKRLITLACSSLKVMELNPSKIDLDISDYVSYIIDTDYILAHRWKDNGRARGAILETLTTRAGGM